VSVTETLVLPAQPTTGSTVIRPLGGDGYLAPQSYYLVDMRLDSDASGGTNVLRVDLDPQFQNVVGLMQASMIGGLADRITRLDIFEASRIETGPRFSCQANMVRNSDVGTNLMYAPPPVFDVGRCEAAVDNVDAEEFRLNMVIYNFRRDAFTRVPLNILLASLPRGFSIQ